MNPQQQCSTQIPDSSKKGTDLSDANKEELMVDSGANGLKSTAVDKLVSLVYEEEAESRKSETACSDCCPTC